jgi:tight adherence protein B
MAAALGAVLGMVAAAGVWVAIVGWTGVTVRDRPGRPLTLDWRQVGWRAGIVVVAFLAGWGATGWPAAGLAAGGLAAMAPFLIGIRERREVELARTEALAAWAEMLRDTIAAGAGLNEAVAVTARVAPEPIRVAVNTLAARAEREPLSSAFRRFAAEVADPVADLIVAALVIADERQAQHLTELLAGIADSARQQAAMRVRVETGRARTYTSSRLLVAITLGLAVALVAFSPDFMEPYDSLGGQVVLIVIGGLFAGALWALVQLGRPAVPPRLLAGIEEHTGR